MRFGGRRAAGPTPRRAPDAAARHDGGRTASTPPFPGASRASIVGDKFRTLAAVVRPPEHLAARPRAGATGHGARRHRARASRVDRADARAPSPWSVEYGWEVRAGAWSGGGRGATGLSSAAEQRPPPPPLQDVDAARQRLFELNTSAWAWAAVCATVESGIIETIRTPRSAAEISRRTGVEEPLVTALLDVAVALGLVEAGHGRYACAPGFRPAASGPVLEGVRADLRTAQLQTDDLVRRARRGATVAAWRHTDPEILEAQGAFSATAVPILAGKVFPALDGLIECLGRPSAAFLDVGTGVGRLAMAMCRVFPAVRVVGIDPYGPARVAAVRNVAEAGLEDRVEVRAQAVQDLADVARYDAAWVPLVFLSDEAVAQGLSRIAAALRPGGWVLAVAQHRPGRDLESAAYRLVSRLCGGAALTPERVAGLLADRGYDRVAVWPRFPGIAPRLIVGRRPPT